MIILGVALLIIGVVAKGAIAWTLGIIVVVFGAILAIVGVVDHEVGGRRHYFGDRVKLVVGHGHVHQPDLAKTAAAACCSVQRR